MARTKRGPTTSAFLACLATLTLLSACTNNTQPSGQVPQGSGPSATFGPASDSAVARYGYAPVRNAPITYQPDVVLIESGAAAIRGVSDDTLTWTLDRRAPGVNDLVVDKVIFATSKAVGRIVSLRDDGDSRVVTLAPVDLTEVIRDGEIKIDQAIDLRAFTLEPIADYPGAVSAPRPDDPTPPPIAGLSGTLLADTLQAGPRGSMSFPVLAADRQVGISHRDGGYDVVMPKLRLVARSDALGASAVALASTASPGSSGSPEPSNSPRPSESAEPSVSPDRCLETKVGDWIARPCVAEGKITVEINHQGTSGLKLGAVFGLETENLRVKTEAAVTNGEMKGAEAVVEGIKGVDVEFQGGVAEPSENGSVRMEVPVEVNWSIPPSPTVPIPINIKYEASLIVETAFSGANSTLTGKASYGLEGPIGYRAGEFVSPVFTVKSGLLDSLGGLPIGVSGVVVAIKNKLQAGIGMPVASAGPYVAVTVAVGVTQGSAFGAPLARCRGATLTIKGAVGFGLALEFEALEKITERLAGLKGNIKTEIEKSWNLIEPRRQVMPDVPLCRAP
jgi:hypothetical protein